MNNIFKNKSREKYVNYENSHLVLKCIETSFKTLNNMHKPLLNIKIYYH